ncbi:hypothetical protein H2202_007348 [Exophiala xenobiotica]|nr:hypothetical protein H2202_007348 [Exophiala xenobiotica]KAK5292164.1 hypothetical protein LTR14_005714 [Exophiala xenobiotica]KAK5472724.1 hypothetical protein LTR20_000183 [Exophiala xenobiotica]
MDSLCTRCARLSLQSPRRLSSLASTSIARRFSNGRMLCAEDNSKPPPNRTPSSSPRIIREFVNAAGRTSSQRAGPSNPLRQTGSPVHRGTLLRRTGAGSPSSLQGAATGQNERSSPPPGPLLRRTGAPRTGGTSTQRPGQRFQPGTARAGGATGPKVDKRIRRRNERSASKAAEEDEDEINNDEKVEHLINTVIDPPPNPTEEIIHKPGQEMSIESLRADWPNTPLSATGLTETVQQRIEWLAHRIPHGYQTPQQLAERYVKGYFTRFESEEEKQEVLRLAEEMAQKRADEITERKNVEVKPRDMSFADVVSRQAERQGLADTYVRGKYAEVQKQKMPFLDHVVENLNNNVTYRGPETDQFMQTVQKLMAAGRPGQAQKGA